VLGTAYPVIVTAFTTGDPNKRSEGYVEIAEGTYSWPYSFTIPPNAPLSHVDEAVEVMYSVSAVVDAPEMPIATSQVSLEVHK
jgi:spermidine/putrescine-binding protein